MNVYFSQRCRHLSCFLYYFVIIFSLPSSACLHMDLNLQNAQAKTVVEFAFYTIFLHPDNVPEGQLTLADLRSIWLLLLQASQEVISSPPQFMAQSFKKNQRASDQQTLQILELFSHDAYLSLRWGRVELFCLWTITWTGLWTCFVYCKTIFIITFLWESKLIFPTFKTKV